MKYVITGMVFALVLVAQVAQAACTSYILPDGRIVTVCCVGQVCNIM